MIYLELTNGQRVVMQRVVIMGPRDLDALRVGIGVITPDKSVVIGFTPDMLWTAGQLDKAAAEKKMSAEILRQILLDSLERSEVREPEYHSKKIL